MAKLVANSGDPDLGLHCLLRLVCPNTCSTVKPV